MLSLADAETLDNVEQLNGLVANDPVMAPVVILTALEPARQRDSFPATTDGLVPPPDTLRRGEKLTVADKAHVTDPGAEPVNLDGRALAGDASPAIIVTKRVTAPMTKYRRRMMISRSQDAWRWQASSRSGERYSRPLRSNIPNIDKVVATTRRSTTAVPRR